MTSTSYKIIAALLYHMAISVQGTTKLNFNNSKINSSLSTNFDTIMNTKKQFRILSHLYCEFV